jgi:hypothetical protein
MNGIEPSVLREHCAVAVAASRTPRRGAVRRFFLRKVQANFAASQNTAEIAAFHGK